MERSQIQYADYMFAFEDVEKKVEAYTYSDFEIIRRQLELIRKYNLSNNKVSFVHSKVCSLTSDDQLLDIDYINGASHAKDLFQPCKFP